MTITSGQKSLQATESTKGREGELPIAQCPPAALLQALEAVDARGTDALVNCPAQRDGDILRVVHSTPVVSALYRYLRVNGEITTDKEKFVKVTDREKNR